MIIEEALYYHLSSQAAGVVELAGTRGFPLVIPQDVELPAWAYQRISGAEEMDHDGAAVWISPRIQLTCVGETYSQAKELAQAMRVALRGFTGRMGGANGVWVHSIQVMTDVDGWGQTAGTNVVRMDLMVLYRELG